MRYYSGKRTVLVSIVTTVLTFVLIAVISAAYIGSKVQNPLTSKGEGQQLKQNTPAPQQISQNISSNPSSAVDVATRYVQPVVGIAVLKLDGNSIFKTSNKETWGVGSGIIVNSNGYILTNHHVAGGKNKRIIVTLVGGDSVDGVTLWSDAIIDLAVVKINVAGLPTAKLGDSKILKVGEQAIAVGNPLGLQFQRTVTSGIISALNRTVQIETEQGVNFMEDLIQTDASINPGNSGGPLMNSKGEVIGVNTIKVSSAEGLGFAIPINIAKPIVNSFINKGRFDEPYLGVFAYDREIMPYLEPGMIIDNGVYVTKVDFGSPAAKSGIKVGDIITKVDGTDMHTMMDLRCALYNRNPNDTIRVDLTTNGTAKAVQVTLGRKNKDGLITR